MDARETSRAENKQCVQERAMDVAQLDRPTTVFEEWVREVIVE
jgi:hypothetical protein